MTLITISNSNVTITGAGPGLSTITMPNSYANSVNPNSPYTGVGDNGTNAGPCNRVSGSNVKISGLTVSYGAEDCIYVDNPNGLTVSNCIFSNAWRQVMAMTSASGPAQNCTFTDCQFNDPYSGPNQIGGNGVDMEPDNNFGYINVNFTGCSSKGCYNGGVGINLGQDNQNRKPYTTPQSITFTNWTDTNSGGNSFSVQGRG